MLYNVNKYLDESINDKKLTNSVVKYSLYQTHSVNFKIKDNKFVELTRNNNNYDPDNSKIVCKINNNYYTYYLNYKTNYLLKNVKFLLNIGFLDSLIKDGFLTFLYNNGEIIGYKTKPGNTNIPFNENNKKLIDFYTKFIEKQRKYGIIMLDCCWGNICLHNNKYYIFDFDQYVDANIYYGVDVRVNDKHTAYWTIDRGYRKYNNMIDILYKNNKILHKKYLFYPENINNRIDYDTSSD